MSHSRMWAAPTRCREWLAGESQGNPVHPLEESLRALDNFDKRGTERCTVHLSETQSHLLTWGFASGSAEGLASG